MDPVTKRFKVRVGDDGRWLSEHDSLGEARKAAHDLSTTGFLGVAQILDTNDGYREQWRDGYRR